MGGVALEEFIGHDSQQDYNTEDAEFQVGGNAEHVDGVVNEPNHGGGNDDAQDRSYATAQAAPAQYGSGDSVKFVKFTGLGRLHGIQLEGEENPGDARHEGANHIGNDLHVIGVDSAVPGTILVVAQGKQVTPPDGAVEEQGSGDAEQEQK